MKRYYVTTTPLDTGNHMVHRSDCDYLPTPHNRLFVGSHFRSHEAVMVAKTFYPNASACAACGDRSVDLFKK